MASVASASEKERCLQVTLEQLTGLAPGHEGSTATVAFSGSPQDMEIGSSSLCPHTGQLIVESEPVIEDRATWEDQVPHLTLRILSRTKLMKSALPESNRDSILVETDDCSACTGSTESSPTARDPVRGGSAFWSSSGDVLPDILELTVRLRGEKEILGTAYLILFGNDRGTYVMDLPVKMPPQENEQVCKVHLRVRVNAQDAAHAASNMPPPSIPTVEQMSTTFITNEVPLTMSQMERNMNVALDSVDENLVLDVDIPDTPDVEGCNVFNWSAFVQTLASVFRCERATSNGATDDSTICTRDSFNFLM